jgi:hypothetical protein
MDEVVRQILIKAGIHFTALEELNGRCIPREQLLSDSVYESIKPQIPGLKSVLSSTLLTSLQKEAKTKQKWPLLNLARQLLNVYGFQMQPVRKSNGYTKEGVKKFKRFFLITPSTNTNKKGDSVLENVEEEL